jgi:hypothetical protein
MRKHRAVRRLVGVAAAATISLGAGASAGLAQYGEEVPPTPTSGTTSTGLPATSTTNVTYLRKKCIAKAQTKFGDNKPKLKKAIKACKKKYKG